MFAFRSFLLRHRWLAFGLMLAALWMKAVVPVGWMPSVSDGRMWVQYCSGQGPQKILVEIAGMSGKSDHQDAKDSSAGDCLFSSLAAVSLSGVAPALLVLALAFILEAVYRAAPPISQRAAFHLRPPPHGPPAFS